MGHIALGYRLYLGPTRYPYCYRVAVPYLHTHHALNTFQCQVVSHTSMYLMRFQYFMCLMYLHIFMCLHSFMYRHNGAIEGPKLGEEGMVGRMGVGCRRQALTSVEK